MSWIAPNRSARAGMEIISIASPLLKCVLPDAPEVDPRFQQDMFASKNTIEDQPRLTARAFEIAKPSARALSACFRTGARWSRSKCFDGVVKRCASLAEKAAKEDLIVGLENEHACNIATASETARVLAVFDHPNLMVVWDPANAMWRREIRILTATRVLPKERIVHVHAKDCHMDGHKPVWGPLGDAHLDWKGQIRRSSTTATKATSAWKRTGPDRRQQARREPDLRPEPEIARGGVIHRRQFLHVAARTALARNSRPLNLIIILVDDRGWTDLGCSAANPTRRRIDRLASKECISPTVTRRARSVRPLAPAS